MDHSFIHHHHDDGFVKFPTKLTTDHIRSWNGHPLTYRLRGLIVHEGSSIAGGHYVAYISMNGIWYKADDSEITRVNRQIVSSLEVYILVYQSSWLFWIKTILPRPDFSMGQKTFMRYSLKFFRDTCPRRISLFSLVTVDWSYLTFSKWHIRSSMKMYYFILWKY